VPLEVRIEGDKEKKGKRVEKGEMKGCPGGMITKGWEDGSGEC